MPRQIKVVSTQVSREPSKSQIGGIGPLAGMMLASVAPMLLEPLLKPILGKLMGNGVRLAGQGKKKRHSRR